MTLNYELEPLTILEELKSFKNQVFKVKTNSNNIYVLKIFPRTSNKRKSLLEAINLTILQFNGVEVPTVFYKSSLHDSHDYLLLEHIHGTTISNLLDDLNEGDPERIKRFKECLEDLAHWMASLHIIKTGKQSFLKGDCNLRNFIWNGSEIYGLDFEEELRGDPREDLGEICFFLLTNSPPLTPLRLDMVNLFLKSYESFSGAKISNITRFIAESARKAYIRRLTFNRI